MGSEGKSICLQCGRPKYDPWVEKVPWRRKWQPTPVLLAGKFHGWRNLVGYTPRGHKESDTTEQLYFLSQTVSKSHSVTVKITTSQRRIFSSGIMISTGFSFKLFLYFFFSQNISICNDMSMGFSPALFLFCNSITYWLYLSPPNNVI